MSEVYCWECAEAFGKSEVFDIPVFHQGFTIVWCFDCAKKQLKWSNYKLVKKKKQSEKSK